jgi:hypothetical protein
MEFLENMPLEASVMLLGERNHQTVGQAERA